MIKIIIGIIVAAILTLSGLLIIKPNVDGSINNSGGSNDPNTLKVSISGEVENEGTYTLEEGATIGDLIEKAGGVTANADSRAYYEEIVVTGGNSYYISGLYNPNDICHTDEIEKVNINTDEAEKLMEINGISSSIAANIVSYRLSDGFFETLEELMNVYGIGNATYKRVRDYVILHE